MTRDAFALAEEGLPAMLAALFGVDVRLERIGPRLLVRGPSAVLLDPRGTVEGDDLFAEQVALALKVLVAEREPGTLFPDAPFDRARAETFFAALERRVAREAAEIGFLEGATTLRRGPFLLLLGEAGHGVVHGSGYGTGEGALWDRLKALVAMTAAETL